jgi:hypothetical protein
MKPTNENLIRDILKFLPVTFLAALMAVASMQAASAQTLLLRYTFDESDGGSADALDSGEAPGASGVFVGAIRTSNTPGGHSKGAADLTGAAAPDNLKYITGGDASKLDGLEAFTLTSWINVQDVPAGNRRILAKQAATSFAGFSWNVNDPSEGVRTANNFGLRLFVGGEKGFQHDVADRRVTIDADKKWVFIAVTYDGRLEAENVIYYSGSVTDIVTNQVTTTINAGKTADSDARFTVSHTDAAITATTALQGWIDDVRVYSGVLKAEQLNAIRLENLPAANPARGVTLLNPNRLGKIFTFDFQSQASRSHRVEFKNSLQDALWQTLVRITGTGGIVTFTDSSATSDARFYRVATE